MDLLVRDLLLIGSLIHSWFVVGISLVVILRYLWGPRKWHIVGMAVSYIILTLNNVYMVSEGFYTPGTYRFVASLIAWIIGDICLLLLLGRASSFLDKYRKIKS